MNTYTKHSGMKITTDQEAIPAKDWLAEGSLEAYLFQQAQARARLDLDTLRDLRATLADADSLICDLICQAAAEK